MRFTQRDPSSSFSAIFLFVALASCVGVVGCDKPQADSSPPSADAEDTNETSKHVNLCEVYTTCDACIAGQASRGNTVGEAETQCALAVTGCWATWDKPIVCGDRAYTTQPGEPTEATNLCVAYTTCNECISGQVSRGNTVGEAETQCALAVTGCWTTWDKPVVCGEQTYEEQPG